MWAINNYYRDQNDDLEKYKLICRFVNPSAARDIWDSTSDSDTQSSMLESDFLAEIRKHTKEPIDDSLLSDKIHNPTEHDYDTIERVK